MNTATGSNNQEIAKEIRTQIMQLEYWALASWGAKDYSLVKNGLAFRIRTSRYQRGAWLKIILNGMDTYDIEVFRLNKTKIKVLDNIDNIYTDQLVEAIDSLIETKN